MAASSIAIDLGTSTITVYMLGKGIVYKQANVVAIDRLSGQVISIGDEAAKMLEKAPETLEIIAPMRSGAVSRFDIMSMMIEKIVGDICKNSILRPNLIISTPVGITAPDKRTVALLGSCACAAKVSVISSTVAGALGCSIDIQNPQGNMIVDIGAGTTDIAVITMGTPAKFCSIKTAGDEMDEAIIQHIKKNRGYDIGTKTAEKIKKTVGRATLPNEEIEMSVAGKDHTTGIPLLFSVTSTEIYEALKDCVDSIASAISGVFEDTSPELCGDIYSNGIILAGGGAKLSGLDEALGEKLKIPVRLMADSENCAAKGGGYAFKFFKELPDNSLSFRIREQIDPAM